MLALQEQIDQVARLDDKHLVASLERVLSQERCIHAQLLLHMAEVEVRGIYRERAYSSMFDYCVQALHMSEAEAYLRIRAARLGREFPLVLIMLEAGELHLSALKLLAPVLTQHNSLRDQPDSVDRVQRHTLLSQHRRQRGYRSEPCIGARQRAAA